MMRSSCAHREFCASFATNAVKTQAQTQVPVPERLRTGEGRIPKPFRRSHQARGSYPPKGGIRGGSPDRLEKSVGYACTTRGQRLHACNLLEGLFPVGKQHAL